MGGDARAYVYNQFQLTVLSQLVFHSKLPRYFTYHVSNYLGKNKNRVGKL
jgi:hypothetical protein